MILAFDTYYSDNKAKTVCISFERWTQSSDYAIHTEILEGVEEYVPGEFYKRELPCIISLLKKIDVSDAEVIIIDGFVFLDDNNKPGLGAHLYRQLESKIPVIGVAKTNFATIEHSKRALLRGDSKNPLFITSIGIDVDKATEYIRNMAGESRVPVLLKQLDRLSKE